MDRPAAAVTQTWFVNAAVDGRSSLWSSDERRRHGFNLVAHDAGNRAVVAQLVVGDDVLAYLDGHGYVGFGRVTATTGQDAGPGSAALREQSPAGRSDEGSAEGCASIQWIIVLDRDDAVRLDLRWSSLGEPIRDAQRVADVVLALTDTTLDWCRR